MNRRLEPIAAFAKHGPFTEHQLRWWIFTAADNGLDAHRAVIRVGRRVYIDVDAFDAWIDSQQRPRAAA